MKRIIILLIFFAATITAQKQGHNWYFGNHAAVTFTSGSPAALPGGSTAYVNGHSEGSASISDSSGALLFYTNGQTVWDRSHQVMLNGAGLLGNFSSTQSSIIIPDPSNPDRYFYLFTISSGFCCGGNVGDGIRYSKVDLCANLGFGEVMASFKNILLTDSVTEKVSACRHSNGVDYWILTHKWKSDKFVAYLLTASGITNTVVSSSGSGHNGSVGMTQGQMKISPDRTTVSIGASNGGNILDVCGFNASTGVVSNCWSPAKPNNNMTSVYGLEFSPNSQLLYVHGLTTQGAFNGLLFQYNLAAGSQTQVNASMVLLHTYSIGAIMAPGLQLGPDNKIYFPDIHATTFLARINSPNTPGTGCNVQYQAVSLGTNAAFYTVPTFVTAYDYSNNEITCCVPPTLTVTASPTTGCAPYVTTLTISGAGTYTWSTGSSLAVITVTVNSNQTISVIGANDSCKATKTINLLGMNCTGIKESQFDQLKIFPVPSSGELFIESAVPIDKIRLTDVSGCVIRQVSLPNPSCRLLDLEPGIYYLEIETGEVIQRKTVVVTKN